MSENLTWAGVLAACQQYNIPPTAKIELATGWECSTVEAEKLYYNISDNILYIAVDGCEDWFSKADIIELKI